MTGWGNVIEGSFIGMDATGLVDLGNTASGIDITAIVGATEVGNLVLGNYIGTVVRTTGFVGCW